MTRRTTSAALALAAALLAPMAIAQPTQPDDPNLWLEDVTGERALAWVRARNAESEAALESRPGFDGLRAGIREVLDSRDQIPYVARHGDWFYNLWKDAANPRGLWRRTTLAEFRKAQPAWETVLDVDALGKAENENWVWAGAACLGPRYERCLISLSRGGADAHVVREFDLVARRFVDGGFALPEAKSSVDWIDIDHLYVGTDFGPGSMTDSGYPRVIKRWTRGEPLVQATTAFEGEKQDVSAFVTVDLTPGHARIVFGRSLDFYTTRLWLQQPGGALAPLPKPDDAKLAFDRSRVLLELRSDWQGHAGGSLLVADAAAFAAGKPAFTTLFAPTATRSLAGYDVTSSGVVLDVLDNVASRLEEQRREPGPGDRWTQRRIDTPSPGNLAVTALYDPLLQDDPLGDAYFLNVADFLHPDSLQLGRVGSDARELLKQRPTFYDAAGMRVEQRFATSKDGSKVPYFVIWPPGAVANGDNPTLLYGYGGFEVSMVPWYSGSLGRAWTTKGGVFAVANIRGGGEFGPAWHQAAVKGGKQTSYDDFAAVAEDLIATKVTRPARLGIEGGSNGGLLVGAVMLQRPELFGAVVCQVPLLDMKRYTKLLAGASWAAEYGDPDDAADWAVIARYSPYQNVRRDAKLPTVLFTTSTRDDRVHPGHARKMAERMREQGHPLLYWENVEGGHGGAADNAQRARMLALEYTFLQKQLMDR